MWRLYIKAENSDCARLSPGGRQADSLQSGTSLYSRRDRGFAINGTAAQGQAVNQGPRRLVSFPPDGLHLPESAGRRPSGRGTTEGCFHLTQREEKPGAAKSQLGVFTPPVRFTIEKFSRTLSRV